MATFAYSAQEADGTRVAGQLAAPDEEALEESLLERGLLLITCEEKRAASLGPLVIGGVGFAGRSATGAMLAEFAGELATAQGAGVSLLTTLEDVAEHYDDPHFRATVQGVTERLRGGATLSASLAAYPRTFSPLFVALVEAGERTGELEKALEDLVRHLEWQDEMRATVKQATIYPASVLVASVGLVILLLSFVLPRFLQIFENARMELPLPTRILMATSHVFQAYLPWMLGAIGLLGFGLYSAWKTPRGRHAIDEFLLSVPIYGKLSTILVSSRFAHNLSMMLNSGLDISASLRLCESLMGNAVLAEVVGEAREEIARGSSLAAALEQSGRLPRILIRLVGVGERSGTLEEMLERCAKHFDRELPKRIKKFFAILDPLVLGFLASLVLFLALATFMPLYGMLQGIR